MSFLNSSSRPPGQALPAPPTATGATRPLAEPTPGDPTADQAVTSRTSRAAAPSPVAGLIGYPLTGRISGVRPDLPRGDGPPPAGPAGSCVIAVVTVEPASQGSGAVRLPLVIAAVMTAPGP